MHMQANPALARILRPHTSHRAAARPLGPRARPPGPPRALPQRCAGTQLQSKSSASAQCPRARRPSLRHAATHTPCGQPCPPGPRARTPGPPPHPSAPHAAHSISGRVTLESVGNPGLRVGSPLLWPPPTRELNAKRELSATRTTNQKPLSGQRESVPVKGRVCSWRVQLESVRGVAGPLLPSSRHVLRRGMPVQPGRQNG